jgi:hypothetical protein
MELCKANSCVDNECAAVVDTTGGSIDDDFLGNNNGTTIVTIVSEGEAFCTQTTFPDDCGTISSEDDETTSWWFRVQGNGDNFRLLPSSSSCSDAWGNVTVAIVAGTSCEDLTCALVPKLFDLSCTSISKRKRRLVGQQLLLVRYLQPITLGLLDFLTIDGIPYYIQLGGIAEVALPSLESLPFDVVSLGPPAPGSTNISTTTEEDDESSGDDVLNATDAPTISNGVDPNNPGSWDESISIAPSSEAPRTQTKKSSSSAPKNRQITLCWWLAAMTYAALAEFVLM